MMHQSRASDVEIVWRGGRSGVDALSSRSGALPVLMQPAAGVYRVVSERVRRSRLQRSRQAPRSGAAVVSIGNLELGGNGKTPLAIHWIEHLERLGHCVVYISRAFKSPAERLPTVTVVAPPDGAAASNLVAGVRIIGAGGRRLAAEVGDEGAMVAWRCSRTPLVFHRDRARAIHVAERLFGPSHIILDDAFQTWAVPRDLDVVLLDAEQPFGNGRLVPAGTLRETPSALRRAGCVGINGFDPATGDLSDDADRVRRHAGHALPVFGITRHVRLIGVDGTSVESVSGERVAMISAIARPARLEQTLAASGLDVRMSIRYPDHFRYRDRDLADCRRLMTSRGIGAVVTTEKDWVKLRACEVPFERVLLARLELELSGDDVAAQIEKPQRRAAASP
jgi:tetraacyldisaccharide 4'-kinase